MGDRAGLIGIVLVIVGTLSTYFWTSYNLKQATDSARHDTWVDESGHLHVLGLTLLETSLIEAEQRIKSRSDTALYLYPSADGKPVLKLEAYFPSISDHSKVILELNTSHAVLLEMQSRASKPRLNRNGVARMNLALDDLKLTRSLTVKNLRLIPSTQLDESLIVARFGSPDTSTTINKIDTRYNYPTIGLQATVRVEEKDELFFTTPAMTVKKDTEKPMP